MSHWGALGSELRVELSCCCCCCCGGAPGSREPAFSAAGFGSLGAFGSLAAGFLSCSGVSGGKPSGLWFVGLMLLLMICSRPLNPSLVSDRSWSMAVRFWAALSLDCFSKFSRKPVTVDMNACCSCCWTCCPCSKSNAKRSQVVEKMLKLSENPWTFSCRLWNSVSSRSLDGSGVASNSARFISSLTAEGMVLTFSFGSMASLSAILVDVAVECVVAAPSMGATLLAGCIDPCLRGPVRSPETSGRAGFGSLGFSFGSMASLSAILVDVVVKCAEDLFIGVDSASRNDGLGFLRDFGEEPKLRLPRMSRRESTIGRTLTCLSLSRAGVSTLERNHATALLGGSFDGRRWFVGDSYMSSSSRICPVSFVEINQRRVASAEGGARAGYGIAGWLAWLSSSESIYCG